MEMGGKDFSDAKEWDGTALLRNYANPLERGKPTALLVHSSAI